MRILLMLTIIFILLFVGCETTAPKREASEKTSDTTESVTVGGDIQVRGQYLKSN